MKKKSWTRNQLGGNSAKFKRKKREVSRKVSIYNLDVIISVGYRVKSQIGTEFRKWATKRLKEYLLKGYSVNKELLKKEQNRIAGLKKEISILNEELFETQKILTDGFLSIISHYSRSFELLEKYDKDDLSSENLSKDVIYVINYEDVKKTIQRLKSDLIKKGKPVIFSVMKGMIHLKVFWEVYLKRFLAS